MGGLKNSPVIHACPKTGGWHANATRNLIRYMYPQGVQFTNIYHGIPGTHSELIPHPQMPSNDGDDISESSAFNRNRMSAVNYDDISMDHSCPMPHATQRHDSSHCDVDIEHGEVRRFINNDIGAVISLNLHHSN
ncbi:hypothetical protein BsWGS_18215 [Bradybaena similaris]